MNAAGALSAQGAVLLGLTVVLAVMGTSTRNYAGAARSRRRATVMLFVAAASLIAAAWTQAVLG